MRGTSSGWGPPVTRRRLAASLVPITAALAACAGSTGAAREDALSKQPPRSVPLTIWARNTIDKGIFDKIAPLVEQRFAHLAITTEAVSDINDKLVVALAGGTGPDLAVLFMAFFAPMVGKGAFRSLQPFIARDRATEQELKSFTPPSLQAFRAKGELYAVPITSESIVCWYNEDLLRQYGLTPPHELEDDVQKWTWDTMLDYSQKLNRGRGQDREVFGLSIGEARIQGWGNLVYTNGGRIVSDDGTKLVMSQPATVEAIQWAVDTIWKHDVAPQRVTLQTTLNRALFAAGRLAMLIEGEYFRRYLFGPQSLGGTFKFNLSVIPFSPRTKKRASVYHSLALGMMQSAKVPDAAWQYLTVFATKDAQQLITDGWGSRGGNQKTYESWLKSNAGGGPPANYAAIVKADATTVPVPLSPYMSENDLIEPLVRLMPKIYDNALSVRDGLQQIDQETNAKLEPAVRAAGSAAAKR